jgi:membrane protein
VTRFWLHLQETLAGRFTIRLVELRVVDRALALTAKLFIAVLPVSILATSLVSRRAFGDELVARFGLTGEGARAARTLFASPSQVQAGLGFLGVVILASSVLSFARALEGLYVDCWRLPPAPGRAYVRRLTWLAGFCAYTVMLSPLRSLVADPLTQRILAAIAAGALFLWTPSVLLGHRVPWRRLIPTAVLTGGSMLVAGVISAIVMPSVLTDDTQRYGLIGFAFGIVTWLFAITAVVIAAAALGSLIDERGRPAETSEPEASVYDVVPASGA